METIYETPESWGNEPYFFTESKIDEFLTAMESCADGDIECPLEHVLNEETGFYESKYYKNVGRQLHKLIDCSDESNLIMEYIGEII